MRVKYSVYIEHHAGGESDQRRVEPPRPLLFYRANDALRVIVHLASRDRYLEPVLDGCQGTDPAIIVGA